MSFTSCKSWNYSIYLKITKKDLLRLINNYAWVQVISLKENIFLLKNIFEYKKKKVILRLIHKTFKFRDQWKKVFFF